MRRKKVIGGVTMANEKALFGKTAIVTGGSKGIGLAVARVIGKLGARVSICARDQHRLDDAVETLRMDGTEAMACVADVSVAEDITTFVEKTKDKFGPVQVLVNNAGRGIFKPAHQLSLGEWDSVMDANLKGAFLMCRAVVPDMIQRGGGDIINIASLAGKNAFAGGGVYCASKWGLLGLTHCMAEDLRDAGIKVSAICPGSVATEFMHSSKFDVIRMLQADDIAQVVEMILTQAPQSFLSEISIRPARKP
jgi:3-oxoacyl-[acyl-carrier protein] reductase